MVGTARTTRACTDTPHRSSSGFRGARSCRAAPNCLPHADRKRAPRHRRAQRTGWETHKGLFLSRCGREPSSDGHAGGPDTAPSRENAASMVDRFESSRLSHACAGEFRRHVDRIVAAVAGHARLAWQVRRQRLHALFAGRAVASQPLAPEVALRGVLRSLHPRAVPCGEVAIGHRQRRKVGRSLLELRRVEFGELRIQQVE